MGESTRKPSTRVHGLAVEIHKLLVESSYPLFLFLVTSKWFSLAYSLSVWGKAQQKQTSQVVPWKAEEVESPFHFSFPQRRTCEQEGSLAWGRSDAVKMQLFFWTLLNELFLFSVLHWGPVTHHLDSELSQRCFHLWHLWMVVKLVFLWGGEGWNLPLCHLADITLSFLNFKTNSNCIKTFFSPYSIVCEFISSTSLSSTSMY